MVQISLHIDNRGLAALRDELGHLETKTINAGRRDAERMANLTRKSIQREITRQGLEDSGRLFKSFERTKKREGKRGQTIFYWDMPIYGKYMNDLKHSYWAPTFVEGNTAKGPFKQNIVFLESWRKSLGLTKEELPFIYIRPNPWLSIAFANIDNELDSYLKGTMLVDDELRKMFMKK